MPRFMLLIRGGVEELKDYSPEQYQQVLQRYFAWSDKLRSEGRNLGGDELHPEALFVRKRDGTPVIDGPYTETKEAIGGYFIIEALSRQEAAEIAKECPAVGHGGFVEVREIVEHTR